MDRGKHYYFGSYGLIRGYGPLFRTLNEADKSVRDDGKAQRANGGTTDRNAVAVCVVTGLCWWVDEEEFPEVEKLPVRIPSGEQAKYSFETIRRHEQLWLTPTEMAGFG